MLILGIDTSGRQGSIALLQVHGRANHGSADREGVDQEGVNNETLLTLELAPLTAGQPSETLVPAIAALLARHGLERHAISLIAVASGPGSFTGLRVAIATAKGLAEAFAIPVVPVSVLEAILLTSEAQGKAIAAIDAQRNEVFFGEIPDADTPGYIHEDIATFADFVSALTLAAPQPRVFTPDESLAARLREAAIDTALVARPSAEDIARIAHRKFLLGVRADVATLDANYLRRSDAELFSAPKLGAIPHSR